MLAKNLLKREGIYGFSLIELILVILCIAILSITLAPKWLAPTIHLNAEAHRLLYDIRYAQAMSLISGQRYRWVKLSASSYQITNEAGNPILLPSGGNQLTFSSNVIFGTITNLPNNILAFDSFGTPYIDSSYPGTPLSTAAVISLSGSGQTRSIQINPVTGFGVLL